MGMFDSTQPFDAQTFNYGTEQDKVKRRRALAESLMQAKQPQGQMVPGGPNGFYVKPSLMANLGPMIQQIAGAYLSSKADDDQKGVDVNSLDAFTKQYSALGNSVRDPKQDGVEATAEMTREARRGQGSGVDAGESVGAPEAAQSFPVSSGQVTTTDLPATPVQTITPNVKAKVAQALKAPSTRNTSDLGFNQARDSAAANTRADPNIPSDNSILVPGAWENIKSIGSAAKAKAAAALAAVQHFTGADGSKPNISPPAPPQAPATPQGPTALPVMPQIQPLPPTVGPAPSQPAAPQQAPQPALMPTPQVAPQQAPVPQPAPNLSAPVPQSDGTLVAPNDADPYSKAPTQQQMVSRLIALGRTGPEGQQIANAQLNQMFASKNGRYSTTVHADPVNGGFVQVTTDSQTGQSQFKPISASGGSEKVLETKVGSDGNMLERTAGGWRKAQMQGGGSVMTQEGQAAQAKDIDAKAADQSKLGDMKQQLASMQELVPLINKVGTGRLQTPWNNMAAYFTNSDDLDKMNRGFSTQKLEGAVQWLKGQGSVTDAERKLLAESQFDPKSSTQSNLDFANKVIGMLQKHIPIAEANYTAKYGDGASTSGQAPQGLMYSWQKK